MGKTGAKREQVLKLNPRCTFFCITIVFDIMCITVFLREFESNAYAFCFGGGRGGDKQSVSWAC